MFKHEKPPEATGIGHSEPETNPQTASQLGKVPPQHTIIPPGVTITGSLSSAGDVHVEGEIHGNITCRELTLTGRPLIAAIARATR